jgi:HK97 family phage portal protein
VELISSTVGTLPAKVFISNDKGGKDADRSHDAYRLVHDDANEWTSAGKLREQLTADALTHDAGGFAFVNRVDGKPFEFIRLPPGTVTFELDANTGEPRYKVGEGRGQRVYSFRDILHVQAPGGRAPIHDARDAIGLAITLEQKAAKIFDKGGRPSGILKFPTKLGPDVAARMSQSWNAAHAGEASGRTAVLEEGGDFTQLTFSSVDLQFMELRTFQIVEVARAFRVPPSLLFEMSRATWSNSEEMNRHFLQFTLLPWLKAWEAAYRRVLLPVDQREGVSIEFITDALLAPTTAARATAYQAFRSAGIMTANEIRARENLPALPDGNSLTSPFTSSATTTTEAPADE